MKTSMTFRSAKTRTARLRVLLGGACEGGALVEFAVVAPLLLLLAMGIATAGVAMNNYLQLTEAVSVGARSLAAAGGITTDPCSTASSAVFGAAPGLTESSFTFSYTLNGTPYSGTTCASASTSTGAAGNLATGTNATLTVTYPCNLTIFGKDYAPGCTLKSQATELVQ